MGYDARCRGVHWGVPRPGGVRTLAAGSEPGSDHQLAFSRSFISSATTDAQLDEVAGLLAGSTSWPGLTVDTDLRWSLLNRLVITGRADDDAIEAELAVDDTTSGRSHAAFARAARPSAVAKELAWSDILDRTDVPNQQLEATIGGFAQAEQLDELVAYRDAYFTALPRVWQDRTSQTAQSITVGLYPFLLVDEQTLDATDAYLAGDVHSAARRLVGEGRDGVVRALAARTKDATG